ncbi:MAG: DUF1461 domain-containing protein [Gordonibacter sp.]|uniref:lipoprotein intramolecular transacylase Lit n=1 Tax=Gordonibacter sp. TaxID=1968902 RepID=UPI002FCC6BD4
MTSKNPIGKHRSIASSITTIVAAIALAITFVAAGFAACCLPQTTQALAGAFSGMDNPGTAFTHDQLVRAAVATRDFTVDSHDQAALADVLKAINQEADTPLANKEKRMSGLEENYTLDESSISHLDDVYLVVEQARPWLVGTCVLAVALTLALLLSGKRCNAGEALLMGGTTVLIVFLMLGIVAAVNFDGFFAVFHSLFFADGTWTFSYESLLITMYPTAFWMGMGAVWLAVTGLLSILAIVVGSILRRQV